MNNPAHSSVDRLIEFHRGIFKLACIMILVRHF